jgi:hypothetical protein
LGCQDDRTRPTPVAAPPSRTPRRSADRTGVGAPRFPAVGTCFLDFDLLALLGSGAFAKVYLARQADLGNRLIA